MGTKGNVNGGKMKVLFIGDSPSRKNLDANVAFLGTKSGERLDSWAKAVGVDYWAVNSIDREILAAAIRRAEKFNQPIVTLGMKAQKRTLEVFSQNGLAVAYYHLPHPSGRNRLFNGPGFEKRMIEEFGKWLSGIEEKKAN